MATVNDIKRYIESIAPTYMAEDWDRVGLNCGRGDREVHTIVVALDPFEAVCQEAIGLGADLLVTHHALIWEPGFVNDETEQGRNTLALIEHQIAHINAHTNLDCAPGGVNEVLAKTLELEEICVIAPKGTDEKGSQWGLLRMGCTQERTLTSFLALVKEKLGCDGLRYVDSSKPVHRVAVGGGACADKMHQAAVAGCDTFVTADVKYNQFWQAKELGINLIDAGHFHTENPVCIQLANKLQEVFPDLDVHLSKVHRDCMKIF